MKRTLPKSLVIAVFAAALLARGAPASAYVAQILTSIPASSGEGEQLEAAVRSAINDVLDHAIAFVPTVIDVREAIVVGDRIYILLLLADDDGAAIVNGARDAKADEL
jgi:ABC-type uncharacterized transport system permease subunit